MEVFDKFTGTIHLRRNMQVKKSVESWDGRTLDFQVLWQFEDDDNRYPCEWALMPMVDDFPEGWIASGDVEVSRCA